MPAGVSRSACPAPAGCTARATSSAGVRGAGTCAVIGTGVSIGADGRFGALFAATLGASPRADDDGLALPVPRPGLPRVPIGMISASPIELSRDRSTQLVVLAAQGAHEGVLGSAYAALGDH